MLYTQALKKIRKEKKVTGLELAKYLNKTRETVSSWERGIYQPCDSDIRMIAQFLNVPVQAISNLSEKQLEYIYQKEEDYSGLDIENLPPNIALKLKTMHNYCLELGATNTKLRLDVFKYRILLQNLPLLIYVKNIKLKYTYVNDQFINHIGRHYNKDSVVGISSSDIFGIKEYLPVLELEQKVIKTKIKTASQEIYIPGTFKKKIGLLTIIPILNDDQSVERFVSSIEDITDFLDERKQKEKS